MFIIFRDYSMCRDIVTAYPKGKKASFCACSFLSSMHDYLYNKI